MTPRHVCQISSIGVGLPDPLRQLRPRGEVIAVFRRSFYVEAVDGIVMCIADRRLGEGPLTLAVELPQGYDMEGLGAATGTPLEWEGEDLRLGDQLLLCTRGAAVWRPPAIRHLASPEAIRCRVRRLVFRLEGHIPSDGLAPLVPHVDTLAQGNLPRISHSVPLAGVAMARLARLASAVLADDIHEMDAAVQGLVGLGPGLTPSGDDLLGGLMVALMATTRGCNPPEDRRVERRNRMARGSIIANLARSVTLHAVLGSTRISAALLGQAAHGIGSAAQHRVLEGLVQAGDVSHAFDAAHSLTRVGHSSGWDSLAGLLMGVHLGLHLERDQSSQRARTNGREACPIGLGREGLGDN